MKTPLYWVKLTSLALLLHLVLIILSFIEVYLYSLLRPGNDEAFYQAHAMASAPWMATIFGSIFIFLIVRWYIRHHSTGYLNYAIAFPVVYIILDILIILLLTEGSNPWGEFVISNIIKAAAGIGSYFAYRNRWTFEKEELSGL